ncbi:MAG: hypothetical protein FJX55_09405 [Alphaproteobacteria bacterium]|nr:hypothetical protein [Alphaproteobacteria bacterium]
MALVPLEVLMYAMIVGGNPAPTECSLRPDQKSVVCTNGVTATEDKQFGTILQHGKKDPVTYTGTSDGRIVFSNGIEGKMTSAGWIKFSNGIQARRDTRGQAGTFVISGGFVCSVTGETKAACRQR